MFIKKSLAALMAVTWLAAATFAQAESLPNFTVLAKNSGPAVVNIGTERTAKGGADDSFGGVFRGAPPGFEKFFEQFERFQGQKQRPQKQRSLGSGFIISADGYIVTNNHVVADADIIRINLDGANGKSESITATLVGADEETDLALLKIDVKHALPFLRFGDSDKAQVGEWLLAIGNPFGLDHTVTAGILSAKGRDIRSGPFDNFLQTDASINPGNSGGPLLNMNGEVIGINTAIIASGQGIGFAIPSNMAAKITDQIKDGKKVRRGWIGVTIQDVDENTAKALGLPKAKGALIGSVMPDEPAAKGGMQAGDVVLSVNGKEIEDPSALLRAIAEQTPGSSVKLVVWRDGANKNLQVTLGERSAEQLSAQRGGPLKHGKAEQAASLGMSVRPVTAEEAKALNLKGGLLITEVAPNKAAAEADLREGDIILSANMKPVHTVAALTKLVKEEGVPRGALLLQVQRRNDVAFKTLVIKK